MMIYIAGPYYDKDPNVITYRMDAVHQVMARLTIKGEIVVSPMLMHPIAVKYALPNNFEYWGKYSLELLSKCDKMCVLKLAGWDTSRGVKEEIEFCTKNNIPIEYIEFQIT